MYKNIIFITGNNSFLIERERSGLVDAFAAKYGKNDIVHFALGDTEKYRTYEGELRSASLFSESRLFVFSGGREKKGGRKKTDEVGFEMILAELAPVLTPTDFLIFFGLTDEEKNLATWLAKNASVREKNISWNAGDWEKYTSASTPLMNQVLALYKASESERERSESDPYLGHNIIHTLRHLAILESEHVKITDDVIDEFFHGYAGVRIFSLIDAILAKNIAKSIALLEKISESIHPSKELPIFIGSLLSNLRTSLFVLTLKNTGKSTREIAGFFPKMHAFTIEKNYNSRISARELGFFYKKIISSNIAYKSGKGMHKNELGQIFDIEIALMELKK